MTALRSAQASGPPLPGLQLHLIGDSDGDVDPCCRSGARRPSNVSLSRSVSALLHIIDGDRLMLNATSEESWLPNSIIFRKL